MAVTRPVTKPVIQRVTQPSIGGVGGGDLKVLELALNDNRATLVEDNVTDHLGNANSADTLTEDATASNTHQINITSSNPSHFVVGPTYNIDMFIKGAGRDQCIIAFGTSGANFVGFNLGTGLVFSKGANVVSSAIASAGSGWYRCQASSPINSGSIIYFYMAAGETNIYSGDGTSSILISNLTISV